MAVVTSKLVLSAQETVSSTLDRLAKRAAAATQSLTRSFQRAEQAGQKLDSLKVGGNLGRQVEGAAKQIDAAAASMKRAAGAFDISDALKRDLKAMDLTRREVAKLTRDILKARADQEKALAGIGNASVRAQLVGKDNDRIEAMIRGRAEAMRRERLLVGQLTNDHARLHRERERVSRQVGSVARTVAGTVGVTGAGYVAQRAIRGAIGEGSGNVREDVRAKNAGLSPDEISMLRRRAAELSLQYPSLSGLNIREQGRLLIPNVGDAQKALELLPEYVKGQVALQTIVGPGDAGKEMETFAKFVDLIGRSRDVGSTKDLIDGYIRGRQLDSGAFNAEDFLNAAKTAGAPGKGLNDAFWSKVFPALAMQQGGARTGTDFTSAYQNTVMGRATDEVIFAQEKAGIRSGVKSHLTKTGKRKLDADGALVDKDLFSSQPYEYAKKHLIPYLVREGALPKSYLSGSYKEDLSDSQRTLVMEKTSALFSNRRGANIFSLMLSDMEQFELMMARLKKTRGTGDVAADQQKDPYVAAEGMIQQLRNFGAALSEPAMQAAGPALNAIAQGLGRLAGATRDFTEKNPEAAKGAAAIGGAGAAILGSQALGWLAGKLAGNGTGVAANALRMLGGGLSATGGTAHAGAALGLPLAAGLAANEAETVNNQGLVNALRGKESTTARLARELREERLRSNGGRDAVFADQLARHPAQARRDAAVAQISQDRAWLGRTSLTGAFGAGQRLSARASLAAAERERDAADEQLRETRRLQARSRPLTPTGLPGFDAPLPPKRPDGAADPTALDKAKGKASELGTALDGLEQTRKLALDLGDVSRAEGAVDRLTTKWQALAGLIGGGGAAASRTSFSDT